MKYRYKLSLIALVFAGWWAVSCSDDEKETYVPIAEPTSPVQMDLTQVPYAKLSDYKFFEGDMKLLEPAYGVIPFAPASPLFTDYAEKKRFVWMPKGTKATYTSDGDVLELPVGAALVKNFYYNHVQPSDVTKIIETRVMIRKETGWIFAAYQWNEDQTEANLLEGGSDFEVTWLDANNESKTAQYRIPSGAECVTCHKLNENPIPIGIKPQNLNYDYAYASGTKNQLAKWVEFGYLEDNIPDNILSVVNYNDASQPLELRVRSYFDSNCAHCHRDGGHASSFALRFPFSQTENRTNMGVCVGYQHPVVGFSGRLVTPSDITRSMVYYRMTTDEFSYRMPLLGRSMPHIEAIQLVEQWINSITDCP